MLRLIVSCMLILLVQACASMPSERAAAAQYCKALSLNPCLDGTLGGQCRQCP